MKEDELLGYLAPIRFSRAQNGYYYSDPGYTIKKVPLNEEEIDSLEFAAGMLERYKGLKVNDAFAQGIQSRYWKLQKDQGKMTPLKPDFWLKNCVPLSRLKPVKCPTQQR